MSQSFTALGLMSGTSLDGIDGAFLRTDGERIDGFGPSTYRAYTPHERQVLTAATQAALAWQFTGSHPAIFTDAEAVLHRAHIELIETLLEAHPDWAEALDVIGFHGQTVLHRPAEAGQKGQTLQLGQGSVLAAYFGVDCVYDFRSHDVASGGQGAPLAPIYHKALCDDAQLLGQSAVLNLGGVGNVTLIDGDNLSASDTGPANGPLDQWMQKHGGGYDKGGAASLVGRIDFTLIEQWLNRPFFKRSVPRSADRYDFDVTAGLSGKPLEDGAATLAAFCALAVAKTLSHMNAAPARVILCGGGRHNKALRLMLSEACGAPIMTAEDLGWNSDMIEAQAFAYLAVRSLKGLPLSFPNTTGVSHPMTGGNISYKP